MQTLTYRVINAPLRCLAFAVVGVLVIMHASRTIDALFGPGAAGLFPFAVLVSVAVCAAYGSWFARDHDTADAPLLHRLGTTHIGAVLIGVLCLLAAFSANGGLISAIMFALLTASLWRVRDESAGSTPRRDQHDSLISDAHIARVM